MEKELRELLEALRDLGDTMEKVNSTLEDVIKEVSKLT